MAQFDIPTIGDGPGRERKITDDVKRYSRDKIMARIEFLWKTLYEPNLVREGVGEKKRMTQKESFVTNALADFDRLSKLPDAEYVAFIRWQRANMGKTVDEFRQDSGFNERIAQVNRELREKK
jgi:hypothetical protein